MEAGQEINFATSSIRALRTLVEVTETLFLSFNH
jgi:hypothetical protein